MKEIEVILTRKGFNIKEWIHKGLLEPKESNDQEQVQLLIGVRDSNEMTEGVLGIRWKVMSDNLKFKVSVTKKVSMITERTILSIVNSIFDPLGMLMPFTVKLKVILRKIWAHEPKLEWDDKVPKKIEDKWLEVLSEMPGITEISFTRALKSKNVIGFPILVIFSDGSEQAYGAVSYIKWKSSGKDYVPQLVMTKSRVALLKTIDKVHLDLCGAVLSNMQYSKGDEAGV